MTIKITKHYKFRYTISFLIQKKHTEEGITVEEIYKDLAKVCGVTERSVKRYTFQKRGSEVGGLPLEMGHKIAEYFKVDPLMLITENIEYKDQ